MKTSFLFIICIGFVFNVQAQSSVDDKSIHSTTTKIPTKPVVINTNPNAGSSVPKPGEETITTKTTTAVQEVGSSVYESLFPLKPNRKEEIITPDKKTTNK